MAEIAQKRVFVPSGLSQRTISTNDFNNTTTQKIDFIQVRFSLDYYAFPINP